jgi:HAMP domain-containing protein
VDIRTRLIFALVAISLVSMAAVGTFAYGAVQDLLLENQLRKLEAVAASKEQDLQRVLVAWRDRVRLVTSRTQLRYLLAAASAEETGAQAGDPEPLERILEDAREAVSALRGIALYTRGGRLLAVSGQLPLDAAPTPEELARVRRTAMHRDALEGPDGEPLVTYLAPMRLDDRRIGSAWIVLAAHELDEVTGVTPGLGRTGETLIVRADPDGRARVLSGRRLEDVAEPEVPGRQGDPIRPTGEAVRGVEGEFTRAIDYRGEPVYAATRWIPDPGWGLVVKVDVAEERGAILDLRDTLWKLALSLSAFGIVGGMVLGLVFSRRLRELTLVARRIGAGEWDLRADEHSEDEIGQLGMTFNRMTEQLVAANRALEARLRSGDESRP